MKIKPRDIKRYNKIAEKGRKPIMVRVGHKWYTWYEGDPKHGVFLTTQSGRDVEFDFKQIDDIEEGIEKLTKSKLKEMIREELLNEAELPGEVKRFANKFIDSLKRADLNKMKQTMVLTMIVNALGIEPRALGQMMGRVKREL